MNEPLEDWFFQVKALRPKLEQEALAHVTRWLWLKGLVNPHHPEPFHWQRDRFAAAKPAPKPGKSASAREGRHEVGFDAEGRMWLERRYTGGARPGVSVWLHLRGRIREASYDPDDRYAWKPPAVVTELTLDADRRVIESRTYGNLEMWPDRALRPADVQKLKRAHPSRINALGSRFVWQDDRIVAIETLGTKGWSREYEIEYQPDGRALRVWRLSDWYQGGRGVVWGRRAGG